MDTHFRHSCLLEYEGKELLLCAGLGMRPTGD